MAKKENKTKTIRCNSLVKTFCIAKLKEITNLGPTEFYTLIKKGKGIVNIQDQKLINLCNCLDKEIRGFLPSVPLRSNHRQQMKVFICEWKKQISQYIKEISQGAKPVYLRDEVGKILQEKKVNIKCTNLQLEWFLSVYGSEHMTPNEIADALIEYDGTDWNEVHSLSKDTHYNICLSEDSPEERAKFIKTIEFLYQIPSAYHDQKLEKKIINDLGVLEDFMYWKSKAKKNYEYADIYMDFVSKLQTAPEIKPNLKNASNNTEQETQEISPAKPVWGITENTPVVAVRSNSSNETPEINADPYEIAQKKFENDKMLSAEEQTLFLRRKRCPQCGGKIEARFSQEYGKFMYCRTCKYSANGDFEHPQIKYTNRSGVRKIHL